MAPFHRHGKHIGRPIMLKQDKKPLKANIWMTEDFPVKVEMWVQGLCSDTIIGHIRSMGLKLCVASFLNTGIVVRTLVVLEQYYIICWNDTELSVILAPLWAHYFVGGWFLRHIAKLQITTPLEIANLSHRLLNILEVMAPFKHFSKLKDFIQLKIPPGFPVKVGKYLLQSKLYFVILYNVQSK